MQAAAAAALTLDGTPVDELCLTFTLPGYPAVELMVSYYCFCES
jgi:hypothetical protein